MTQAKAKSRLTWFLAIFLIFQVGGMITFYWVGIPLDVGGVFFIFSVAILTGLGCAFAGPRFEEAVRQSRAWRKRKGERE